jgi:ATP-dependent Lon protease
VFRLFVWSISDVPVVCLQQSIAKGVEEKMSGDQRKYLLMEQLKAIKKVIIVGC